MNSSQKIIGIMASTREGIVGHGLDLPWSYPDEYDHFLNTTDGHVIIMGRQTYEASGIELMKNRHAIVFSQSVRTLPHAKVVPSLNACLDTLKPLESSEKKIFMIGGAQLAHLFFEANLISSFILTEIHKNYGGDIRLNLDYFRKWKRTEISAKSHYTIYNLENPYFL